MLLYHDNGFFNTSNYTHWSESAIMCYERGCKCDGCPIQEIITSQCMMKHSVLVLVKNIGKPPRDENKIFRGMNIHEEKIVNAILNGCNTKQEIAEELNTRPELVQNLLNSVYELAIFNGHVFGKRTYRLPELVEFIRKRAKEKELYD